MWEANSRIKAAILKRLSILLGTKRPRSILRWMIKRDHGIDKDDQDYSVYEDLVVQKIILKYKDEKLDKLWSAYNVGYFYSDTKKFLKNKMGVYYENFIDLVLNDPEHFSSGGGLQKTGVDERNIQDSGRRLHLVSGNRSQNKAA